jgi:general secretion pathway protein D
MKHFRPFLPAFLRASGLLSVLLLTACATIDDPFIPVPMEKPARHTGSPDDLAAEALRRPENIAFYQTPKPPAAQRTSAGHPAAPPVVEDDADAIATVTLDNMPLPQFANVIYSVLLKRNVSIDAQVAQRTDMVTFRTGKPLSPGQLFTAAQALLRSYGVAVYDYSGTLRIVPENNQAGLAPEIRRGKASPEVPAALRPVFYLAELEHVQPGQVSNWLKVLFQNRLTLQDDTTRNAILLSGQSDTVSAAMEAIQMLDQPLMRGRLSARIAPVFWSADEMARRLTEMLQAEGYAVSMQASAYTPILILPVGPVNSIIVFAGNEETLNHILRWAQELDQSPQGRAGNFINYQVRNTDAAELASTLAEVMGMSTGGAAAGGAAAGAGAAGGAGGARGGGGSSRVVVNPAANSLIIQTTPAEFQQWYGLLQELDRPARNALIMATVAEVRLTKDEQFGFQWMIKQFTRNGYNINTGTANAISASATDGMFRIGIASGADPRAFLTALASSNKIRILSNPSVMARNGQDATIQVGQEVPIITGQLSNADTGGVASGSVLQTVQYRSTGVILRVKPVIHAGGRIDLDVSQEVSAAQKNETGVDSSPIILTRKIDTKLTVSDGNTLLLGGLMQEQRTAGNAGVPWLKDIPYAGNLFRTSSSDATERTELVILLTPYVVEDDFDAQAITESFRRQFAWAAPARAEGALSGGLPGFDAAAPKIDSAPEAVAAPIGEEAEPPAASDAPASEQALPVPAPTSQVPAGESSASAHRSMPYLLPPDPGNSLRVDAARSPAQAPSALESASVLSGIATSAPALPEAVPAPAASPFDPAAIPGARPVTDEKLKQELLEAMRQSGIRP